MHHPLGLRDVLLVLAAILLPVPRSLAPAPAATNLTATAASRFAIDLLWTGGGPAETGVEVQRGRTGTGLQQVALLPAGSTTWQDEGLSPATRYAYRVRSIEATGPLPWSNVAAAVTDRNRLPVVTTNLADFDELDSAMRAPITLRVDDPEGDPVTLRLLDPPAGWILDPMERVASGTTRVVRRWVLDVDGGFRWLHFQAFDSVEPDRVVRHRERTLVNAAANAGSTQHQQSAHGDVDGDGLLDLVVAARLADVGGVVDAGAVYVWSDVAHGGTAPTASLTVPGATALDYLAGTQLVITDVTGDGVQDVITASLWINVGGAADMGAIHVFAGGSGLAGSVTPAATLTVPGGKPFDQLGREWIRFVDLDVDGLDDLVVPVPDADRPGARDSGRILVWRGGPSLLGAPPPDATLELAAPRKDDALGESTRCADVTGDGIPDVLATSRDAVWIWRGRAGFSGSLAVDARLADPVAVGASLRLDLADLDQDGTLDILAASTSRSAANGDAAAGALLFWRGDAALSGAPLPTAEFIAANPQADERLPEFFALADVTGDGHRDLVMTTPGTDVNGVIDAGAAHVFASAGGFSGTMAATATLVASSATAGDALGSFRFFKLNDVTGDGITDVVVGSSKVDLPGAVDAGAAFVWAGGPGLAGTLAETAKLVAPTPRDGDLLGETVNAPVGLSFGDVSGDGQDDVVIFSPHRTANFHPDAGMVFVWQGGSTLAGTPLPLARLRVDGAEDGDHLGSSRGGTALFDWTGDGVLDVMAASPWMGSVRNEGAIYLWAGGPALQGKQFPRVMLGTPIATANDQLGGGSGLLIHVADIDADGTLDVLGQAQNADLPGVVDAGKACFWRLNGALTGTVVPSALLVAPQPQASDLLGFVGISGQSLHLIDADEDGKLDVFLGGQWLDIGGIDNAGAVEFWSGASLDGIPAALQLSVPTAQPGDALGGN